MTRQKNLPSDPYCLIIDGCRILNIPVNKKAAEKMIRHMEFIRSWGTRINLTAVTEPREMAILHFLDSLTVFKVIPLGSGLRILDIGSGAGFPGLVLQTADETLQVTLLDRDPKKTVFLKHAARGLNLTGMGFINQPLDNLLDNPSSWSFDCIVSRGFSSNAALLDRLHLLLPETGFLITMAGPSSKNFVLKNFHLTESWVGTLPFSNRFRKVSLHRLN
jgi:16S rRNA (guanine527-N7)-methyltransferase